MEGWVEWAVSSTPQSHGAWIKSARSTSFPGYRLAGPSDRFGVTRWMYADGGAWKEGVITVLCVQ